MITLKEAMERERARSQAWHPTSRDDQIAAMKAEADKESHVGLRARIKELETYIDQLESLITIGKE